MNPTVLLFLRAPEAGKVKTRLAADVGAAEALRIYRLLVERQLAALPDEWPVEIHFTPPEAEDVMRAWLGEGRQRCYHPQPEGELGHRLRVATESAFKRGANAVLLVGGDCPELDTASLRAAAEALAESDVVLGPAWDGGYYLLGMNAPHVTLLAGVPWGTAKVAAVTRDTISRLGLSVTELAMLRDVDTADDWAAVGSPC